MRLLLGESFFFYAASCTASPGVERSDRRPLRDVAQAKQREIQKRDTKERGVSTSDASLEIISLRLASTSPISPEKFVNERANLIPRDIAIIARGKEFYTRYDVSVACKTRAIAKLNAGLCRLSGRNKSSRTKGCFVKDSNMLWNVPSFHSQPIICFLMSYILFIIFE